MSALASEWDALLAQSPRPSVFLSWPWIWSWWEVYGAGKELRVLAVRGGNGELQGVLPAHISSRVALRCLPVRRLSFLGQGESVSSDHMDLLAAPEAAAEVARVLADWLSGPQASWDVMDLKALGPDSAVARHLAPELKARGLTHRGTVPHSRCPYYVVPRDAESFWGGLSPRFRKNLRRARRNLEQAFRTEILDCASEDSLPTAMAELGRLHNLRKEQQGMRGKFEDARYRRFHDLVARRMLRAGRLALFSLRVDDRIAAAEYAFRYGGVLYEYQTGFDPGLEEHGVLNVLESHIVERAIGDGLSEIDLLRGEEPYKSHWTKTARQQMALIVENRTPRGKLHHALTTVRGLMGAVRSSLLR
jgi:CelD/BcsL family acetyltransferase involved in cellulose biosynthesis